MHQFFRVAIDSIKGFDRDDGYAMSSHIALSGLTAIFPFLIFVTSLAGFLGAQPLADSAAATFFEIWPPRVSGPIAAEIHNVLSNRHGGLLTISAALAFYFASSGVEALRTGLNRAYGAREYRPWWRLRLQSLAYVFIGAMALLSLALLLVLGPIVWGAIVKEAPALREMSNMVILARYAVSSVILLAALIIAHRFLPAVKLTLFEIAPGIALTFTAWLIFAFAFSSYLGRFALNYVATYAGLASVMIAILFLYSLGAIFIFGAQVNAVLIRQRAGKQPQARNEKGGAEAPPFDC